MPRRCGEFYDDCVLWRRLPPDRCRAAATWLAPEWERRHHRADHLENFFTHFNVVVELGRQKTLPSTKLATYYRSCVVSIDSVNGIVTARDLRTGETFKFEVDSRSLLKTMRVGQKVWKDAGTRKVSVMDGELCCTVIGNTNLDLADSGRQSAEKGSTGVIRNGNTLTLEKGYEATIDRKGKRVRVREFGGDWRPSSTHTCECDSDENAKCAWEAVRKQVHCTSVSGACQNCQVYETTKEGRDG